MARSIVIDIETLGTYEDSVILSYGAVWVDFAVDFSYQNLIDRGFYVEFDKEEQIKEYGRKTDQNTMKWWSKQSPEAKQVISKKPSQKKLKEGFEMVLDYFKSSGIGKEGHVWSRGVLDLTVPAHCYRQLKVEAPFYYSQARDIRTAIDLLANTTTGTAAINKLITNHIKHNALHDAAYDAMMLKYYEEA